MATTMLPFTVARITTVNFSASATRRSGRNGIAALSPAQQRIAVAQQEEQQVQHHCQPDPQAERDLPDVDRLRGEKLATPEQALGDALLHGVEIAHAEAVEQVHHPCRQRIECLAPDASRI